MKLIFHSVLSFLCHHVLLEDYLTITEYIPYDTLESFSFEIRQFNAQSGEYDIVVSDTGTNEHFTFEKHENTNEIWTQESETVNRGKIKICYG